MMNEKEFEQTEQAVKEALQEVPREEVPLKVLDGFRDSVKRQILSGDESNTVAYPWLAPALGAAGLCLALILVFGLFVKGSPKSTEPAQSPVALNQPVALPQASETVYELREGDLVTEIEILRELDVWDEADEEGLGISVEERFLEMEIAFENESTFNSFSAAVL